MQHTTLGTIVVLIISLLTAFFVVFNVLFSDTFSFWEQASAVGITAAFYLVLPLIATVMSPSKRWRWFMLFALPAVAVLILLTISEPERPVYHVSVAAGVLAGTFLGSWLGALLRGHRRAKEKTPAASQTPSDGTLKNP